MARLEFETGERRDPLVTLLKDMRPEDVAKLAGGKLQRKGFLRTPWEIKLKDEANILWASSPRKQKRVFEMTPFLNYGDRSGRTIHNSAVVMDEDRLILVYGTSDGTITGTSITKGKITEFKVPFQMANETYMKAARLAEASAQLCEIAHQQVALAR